MQILKISLWSFLLTTLIACQEANADKTEIIKEKTEQAPPQKPVEEMSYIETSQALLQAIKNEKDTKPYTEKLATVTRENLNNELNTEAKKLAFWVNVYNAQIQLTLSENPDLYKDKDAFFGEERFTIAGKALSFDLVEHGIIRSSTMKISMGYVGKIFTSDFEELFRTKERDPRIHFVLNCGAKDCPPVYIFQPETLNEDFDSISKAYLETHTTYMPNKDKEKKDAIVKTTPLMSWFRGDFDGKDGVLEMLQNYGLVPQKAEPEVEFKDYDWTLDLGNFG